MGFLRWYDVIENQRKLLIGIFMVVVLLSAYALYRDHGISVRLASSLGLLAGGIGGFTIGQRLPLPPSADAARKWTLYSPFALLALMVAYSYGLGSLRTLPVVVQLSAALVVGAIFTTAVTYARRARTAAES
ncbi:MAG: hypothetical protein NVS3B28_18690 [Candidatus Velthaea sp.]